MEHIITELPCLQVYLKSHFAQPNSIEFSSAVAWRHLQRVIAAGKAQLRAEHAHQLSSVMKDYLQVHPPWPYPIA